MKVLSPRRARRVTALAVSVALVSTVSTSCDADAASDGEIAVRIGYQSKTINTVTAGTLMRDLGLLEKELAELGESTGKTYRVSWHDFASGPPLTAEMIAGKVDIGSMGDYPLSVNGAKTADLADVKTRWVSVTGYNPRGMLNQVVVPKTSTAKSLRDLRGQVVSTSVGSTAHGNLVSALTAAGMTVNDIDLLGQDPPVGVSALESGKVAALAQFVPFPQRVIYSGEGRLLHDGDTGVPTFHGVVAGENYGEQHPEVLRAFLQAQRDATEYLYEHPLEAAQRVAKATGLPPEVVYLYNGPNGLVTFDLTIKDQLVDAVESGLPFLKELGALSGLDVASFVDEQPLKTVFGDEYAKQKKSLTNPAAITGTDTVCDRTVSDPATASEAWPEGAGSTKVAATPTCLLKLVARGGSYRALYVPDADSGARLFANAATWVNDPAAKKTGPLLPFGTPADAQEYSDSHAGSEVLDYDTALAAVK